VCIILGSRFPMSWIIRRLFDGLTVWGRVLHVVACHLHNMLRMLRVKYNGNKLCMAFLFPSSFYSCQLETELELEEFTCSLISNHFTFTIPPSHRRLSSSVGLSSLASPSRVRSARRLYVTQRPCDVRWSAL